MKKKMIKKDINELVYKRGFEQVKVYREKYYIDKSSYKQSLNSVQEVIFGVVCLSRKSKGFGYLVDENYQKRRFLMESVVNKPRLNVMSPVLFTIDQINGKPYISKIIVMKHSDIKIKKEFDVEYRMFGRKNSGRVTLRS